MLNNCPLTPVLRGLFLCVCAVLFYQQSTHAEVKVGTIKQISIGTSNTIPAGASGSPAIAINAAKIVFDSTASNLVSADANGFKDIFETDVKTAATKLISVNTQGIQANSDSDNPTISQVGPDGFYAIAFESDADNLGSVFDQQNNRDIIVRIPSLSLTEYVSLGSGGIIANGNSRAPSIAALAAPNRIRVAFESDASNLVSADNNNKTDIFLATMTMPATANATELLASLKVSRINSAVQESNGASVAPKISGDGSSVVFTSSATNLIPGVVTSGLQVFRYDVATGAISLISRDANGAAGNGNSFGPSVSYSGRYVSFITAASSIISGATPQTAAAVVFDTSTLTTTRVNSTKSGLAGDGSVSETSIASNGKSVTFSDSSTNIVEGDTNNLVDVFVKDLSSGQISRISIGESGNQGNAKSDVPSVAGAGFNSNTGFLVFRSFATNLTAGGLGSGSDIYANSAVLPARVLTRKTFLEVPPDVLVKGKSSSLVFEKFSGVNTQALQTRFASNQQVLNRADKLTVSYDIKINKIGGKKKDNIRKISKKNQISFKGLKPGNYSASYRALSVRGGKTVRATKFCPPQMFTVVKK